MGLFILVGVPGIEPGLYEPESHVLPVYYTPPSLKPCLRRQVLRTSPLQL